VSNPVLQEVRWRLENEPYKKVTPPLQNPERALALEPENIQRSVEPKLPQTMRIVRSEPRSATVQLSPRQKRPCKSGDFLSFKQMG